MNTSRIPLPFHKVNFFQIFIVLIIACGIILRASKYLPAWSLRGDELSVTFNLIDRSAWSLMTQPLDFEQAAPFGFLLANKALLFLFGQSEYVLRLIAFLSGCVSLILMHHLLIKTAGKYGHLFALCAFAVSHYLIYYASELKQYSSDVLICIVLVIFFQQHISRETNERDFWSLGIVGIFALCFSHPAIFVIIPIGLALLVHYLHDHKRRIWISIVGVGWAGVFLTIYLVLLRHQTTSAYLIQFWADLNSYMPLPPWNDLAWFPGSLSHLFSNLGGFARGFLLLISLYGFGLWMFLREKKWQWLIVLTLPIAINMIVSGFQKFPFHGRLIIYLLPLVYIVFAKAIDGLTSLIRNRLATVPVFLVLSAFLLQPAIPTASMYLRTRSYVQDDIKPVLSFLREKHQAGDIIYLYHATVAQFKYYAPSYELDSLVTIQGGAYPRNARKYSQELDSLPQGQRIWFLFSFVGETRLNKDEKQDEREYILHYLAEHGTLLHEMYSTNKASSAHLFLFNE